MQIGHVRRRVVSHGVLASISDDLNGELKSLELTCTLREIRDRKEDSLPCSPHPRILQDIRHTPFADHHTCAAMLRDPSQPFLLDWLSGPSLVRLRHLRSYSLAGFGKSWRETNLMIGVTVSAGSLPLV